MGCSNATAGPLRIVEADVPQSLDRDLGLDIGGNRLQAQQVPNFVGRLDECVVLRVGVEVADKQPVYLEVIHGHLTQVLATFVCFAKTGHGELATKLLQGVHKPLGLRKVFSDRCLGDLEAYLARWGGILHELIEHEV
jgi:hypothetical protein